MAIVVTHPPPYAGQNLNLKAGYAGAGWKYPGHPIYKPKPVVTRTTAATTAKPASVTPVDASQQALLSLIKSYQANLLSPAQQAAMAKQQTDSQIKMALAGIQASTRSQQDYANQQANRAQGFAEALASMSNNDQQAVASLYNDAAERSKAFGTGLTGAVADAYKQQSDQSAAETLAATGGLGHLGSVSPDALRNVAQFTGVTLPGRSLSEEAANQGAQARWADATAAGHISNIASDYLSKAQMAQQALGEQRATLEATRPDLYQKAITALQTGNRSDMATIIQALALMGTQAQIPGKIAGQAATTAGTKATTAGTKVKTTVTQAAAEGKTPSGKPGKGLYFVNGAATPIPRHSMLNPDDPTFSSVVPNPNDPPAGQHYDPQKKRFVLNPKTSTGSKGTSVSAVTTISKGIPKIVESTYAANTTDAISKRLGDPDVWVPKMTWAKAYAGLLNLYPADRRNQPRVKQAVIDALTSHGYVMPTGKTIKKTTVVKKTPKKTTVSTASSKPSGKPGTKAKTIWGKPGAAGRQ